MKRRVTLTQSECEREGEMGVGGGEMEGKETYLHTPIAVST